MKKIWFGIGAAVIVALLLLQTRFKTYMQVDYNGYAIEDKTVRTMLLADPNDEKRVESADLYSFNVLDYIYSRGNSYYMGEGKKTKVDLSFPLLINGGSGVWFLDDTATLFNTKYERFSTYSGLTVSEKVSYNPGGERAADDEYYFAGLKNGFFVNLGSFSISQGTEKHIPMNSMIYFTESYLSYCEVDDESVTCKVIDNIRPDAPVTVGDEELTYKQLLINLRVLYDVPEKNNVEPVVDEPPVSIPPIVIDDTPSSTDADESTLEEDKEKDDKEGKVRPPRAPRQQSSSGGGGAAKRGGAGSSDAQDQRGVRPDSLRPDKVKPADKEPIPDYVKPTVKVVGTDARVYRILVDVEVDDPAQRIDKLRRVQLEFYEQLPSGKETLAYRSFTSTGGTVTAGNGGIKPDTEYRINVFFTYLDEYDERVVESVASDIFVTTGSLSSIGNIVFRTGEENGIKYMDIPYFYDRYAEIVNVTYDASSDEEAVYGIDPKAVVLTAKKGVKDYVSALDASTIGTFKKGTLVIFDTAPNLEPKSEYTYEITAKDFFGNDLTLVNNTGTFRTCKSRPMGSIELVTNKIADTQFTINIMDPDKSSIAPEGGASGDRDVYFVLSTKKIDNYENGIWDDVNAYIDNSWSRVNFGQDNEGSIHFVKQVDSSYISVDSEGGISVSDFPITTDVIDLNTKYYGYLLADYNLDNNRGDIYHDQIADITFKSATLSSLGNIYINVDISNITSHGANIIYSLNKERTDDQLEKLLSRILFTIDTNEGENPGVHSAIAFDDDAMNSFTGYERDHSTVYSPVTSISMDTKYFDHGDNLSDADKNRVIGYKDLKDKNVVQSMPAYYLESMTNYSITPTIYAVYNNKEYDMNVTLTRSSFKTMRETPIVSVTEKLLAAGTLRCKIQISDPDEAITGNSGHVVVVNLYDSKLHLVKAIRVPKNTDAPIYYEFTGLDANETFKMNFVAVEYNLGYDNSTFESNKLIHVEEFNENIDISGNIKLLSLNDSTADKLRADTRVIIYDNERRLENDEYYIDVERNGVDITSSYDTSLTKVTDHPYVQSTNTINKTSSWFVDKGDIKYKMTLYVYINNNKLILDTLEFNSKDIIREISSAEDFIAKVKANPSGRFVVTADIDMDDVDLDSNGNVKATLPSAGIVGTFRGEIDFQGYTLHKNKYKNEGAMFGNLSPKAEIYNAVFEFSDNSTTRSYDTGILVRHNYGHIHDIMVHYTGGTGLQNTSYGLVACRNAASGIIERFVIKNDPADGSATFTARSNCGLLVYLNDGIVRNGYVYGSDINSVTSTISVGGAINVGGIIGYQNPRGQTSNVFSLVNVVISNPDMNSAKNHDTQYGSVIGYAAGSSRNMYGIGQSMYNQAYGGKTFDDERPGPALGTNTTTQYEVYYYNDNNAVYPKATKQTAIGLDSLYDYNFQGSLLGSGFDAQPVEVGYYPHVILNAELPEQEFIELPEKKINRLVEVVSTEVESYGPDGDSAIIKLRLNNPRNAAIKSVEIENLTVDLLEDDNHKTVMLDGYTTTYITVSNPQKFVSLYKFKSISAIVGNGVQTVTSDALLSVDFFRLVHNPDEWYDYVVMKPDENARLANDIDFAGIARTRIQVTKAYTGKLDGGKGHGGAALEQNEVSEGYHLKNINFAGTGYDPYLFNRVDGSVSNLCLDNFVANVPGRTYNGTIGQLYGEVRNVHANNTKITGCNYLSALVCYAQPGSVIENCSATNPVLTYAEPNNSNTEAKLGAIAARADSAHIENCFVRDAVLYANDLRTCLGAGAVVGYSGTSVLNNLYATGDVTVRGNYVGGIVGYHTAGNISNVMSNLISRVNVTSYQDKVGGMVGGMNMSESPLDNRNNMSGVALGNVLCVNTDSENVSYTTGYMGGYASVFYGADFQLFNGITNAKFDEGGILIKGDPSFYPQDKVKNWDKNTLGLITYDQAKDPSTYQSILNMDAGAYDYSKAASEKLPTLYYYGTTVEMPFQPDTPLSLIKVQNNLITVNAVYVSEDSSVSGHITFDLSGPDGYIITGYNIEKLNTHPGIDHGYDDVGPFASGNTRLPVTYIYGEQQHYLDSYMLTSISYKSADGSVVGTSDYSANPVRVPLTLYADIYNKRTWNEQLSEERNFGDYENYNIINDIDFGDSYNYNKNVKIGRLRGLRKDNGSGIIKLSNIHIDASNTNLILRLNSELSNLRFEDCSVKSGGRECTGLIGVSSGAVYDVEFKNVTVTCTGTSAYVGLIGYQNGGCFGKYDPATVDPDDEHNNKGKISLKNVTIGNFSNSDGHPYTNPVVTGGNASGSAYAGALTGYAKGNTYFENIIAENVNVYGNSYVGGLCGNAGKANFEHIRAKDFTVESNNGGRVGGIVGSFTPGRTASKTGAYFTDVELTGTPVPINGYTDTSSTNVTFRNGNTSSTYIGGLIGYTDVYWLGSKPNSSASRVRVNRTLKTTDPGYDSAETHVALLVNGIVVKGVASNIGGMFGYTASANWDCHCYNTLVTAKEYDNKTSFNYVGGIAGQNSYENQYNVTKNTLIKLQNHGFVGLSVGYQSASASMNYCKVEDSMIDIEKTLPATTTLKNVGGVTGYNYYPVNMSTCYNVIINAPDYDNVGGVTGYANNSISRCFYYATPESSDSPEALPEYVVKGRSYVGGVVGYHYTTNVSYSYSNANVIATEYYAGGISGAYRNNYLVTQISGKDNYSYSTATMYYDYFAGMVKAKDYAGGLTGYVSMASVANTDAAANGGRRATARNNLIRTGSANEAAYTYRNMGLASVIMTTDGTHAYAFAGNLDGFEGKASTSNAGSPYNVLDDLSNVDKATMTFFWNGTIFDIADVQTPITELKMADAPEMAQSTSTFAQSIVTSASVPARYLPYGNTVQANSAYNAIEANASASLNVRLVSADDLDTHGPYYSLQWTGHTTNGNSNNPMWRGKYSVILTKDTKTYPSPYSAGTYGYRTENGNSANVGTSYLPHVRVNDLNNNTASDLLTEYQVRKGMNLPVPRKVITRARKFMAARPMGAPNVSKPVVYTSDADKINIEFAADALSGNAYYKTYLKVYYGNELEPLVSTLVDKRVYTLNYDFAKKIRIDYGYAKVGEFISDNETKGLVLGVDFEIEDILEKGSYLHSDTVKIVIDDEENDENAENSEGTDTPDDTDNSEAAKEEYDEIYIYRPTQLARHVMTYGNAYYYITNGGVNRGYGTNASDDAGGSDDSAELIAGDFVNIYNGRGLLRNGGIVDFTSGETRYTESKKIELLDNSKPLESFILNGSFIKTYYNYSAIGDGEDAFDRDSQILKSKNGNVSMIHSSVENIKDSVVLYSINGEEYLNVLGTDGVMIDLYQGDDINVPKDFKRGGIVYMTNNFETSAPFILVEYQNGGIVGFNYMTGKYLFDNSIKNEMSLLDYVKVYLNEEKSKLSSAPAGYAATQQVADFAGSPDRLQSFAFGVNEGDTIEGNSTDNLLKATSESGEKKFADEDEAMKAGEETTLKGDDTGLSSDKKSDPDELKTPAIGGNTENPADGSVADGDAAENGLGLGKGTTASQGSDSETGGTGDVKASEEGGSTSKAGTSKADGSSMGTGDEDDGLPEPDLEANSSAKDKNISSDDATGTGKNKIDAKDNNPSKKSPDVVPYDDTTASGDGSSTVANSGVAAADTPAEHSMLAPEDDGTTDGVSVGKAPASVKNDVEGEEVSESTETADAVTTEKRLMTVYNQSTGTYEIIDMDQFLNSKDYKSENDRLAIRDFGVYGGYATAEKPKDEDQRNGVLLYILVSIALLVGVSGGIYYKKKHKVKI